MKIGNFEVGGDNPLMLIAGPCQIETLDHARLICGRVKEICDKLGISFVYKSSYDKANRTSLGGKRGVGIDAGLDILGKIKQEFSVPILTDVHETSQIDYIEDHYGNVVDIYQIPAFLCRQTDLLLKAGETGKAVNVKKGQFLAPQDMHKVADKVASTGNKNILLTERGYTHGYNNLVVDMRSLPIMERTGYPVVFDATHSVQQPGGLGTASGGDRTMVPPLARAAIATGSVSALFIETHQDPDNAPSDGPNMVYLNNMEDLLYQMVELNETVRRLI